MKKEIISKSLEETQKLGEDFIRSHPLGSEPRGRRLAKVIALYGDLGAGKTTFTQGLAKGLGIKKRIISPTFTIIRKYALPIGRQELRIKNQELGIRDFYHVDLYRVKSESDIGGLGLDEIIRDPENLVVIEWAEKVENLLPKESIKIKFEYLEGDKRRITIERINN